MRVDAFHRETTFLEHFNHGRKLGQRVARAENIKFFQNKQKPASILAGYLNRLN
jgi:hypothetical protein